MSKERIGTFAYRHLNPDRLAVRNVAYESYTGDRVMFTPWAPKDDEWVVMRAHQRLSSFPTHAEAIAYADREARRA